MKPLNGKTAMTREEKNARRRELDSNPFHRALTRKVAKAWRDKHSDELNARRREKYAANKDAEHARQKAWRDAHKDACKKAWKKWAHNNRERLHRRDKVRYDDPEYREKKKARRKELMKNPQRRARVKWQKRLAYHQNKNTDKGVAWLVKYMLEPRWLRLIEEPKEAIEKYRKRCTVRTWTLFVKWARERGLYFDPQKTPDPKRPNDGGALDVLSEIMV